MPLEDIVSYLDAIGVSILSIEADHVITAIHPEPDSRHPFDRLLLAQCQAETLRLVTLERAVLNHPLALQISQNRSVLPSPWHQQQSRSVSLTSPVLV